MSELVGRRFGRLIITAEAEVRVSPSGVRMPRVVGRCDCGTIKEFFQSNVIRGLSSSCGCYTKERSREAHLALRIDEPSYTAAHNRTRTDRGSARARICMCGNRAADWAYDHCDDDELIGSRGLVYSRDPSHYVALCKKCHYDFDLIMREVRAHV